MSIFLIIGLFPILWAPLLLLRLWRWPRLLPAGSTRGLPKLSVLIPARNAAPTVGPCVESLLQQRYPDFELLLLDDHSTDGTGAIALAAAGGSERFRRLRGRPLPEGWVGNSWARHQLAEVARGEYLLFLDAGTLAEPELLARLVATAQAQRLDLLAGLPKPSYTTVREALQRSQPLLSFALLRPPTGESVLIRRESYRRIGPHAGLRQSTRAAHDLLRLQRRGRGRVGLFNLSELCQSRRSTPGIEVRLLPLLLGLLWLLFLLPPGALLLGMQLPIGPGERLLLMGSTLLGWLLGALLYRSLRLPAWLGLLMPLQVLYVTLVALRRLGRSVRTPRRATEGRGYA